MRHVPSNVNGILFLLAVVTACAVIFFITYSLHMTRYSEEVYQAWCRAQPAVDISYEDWKRLAQHEMLPNQVKDR